MDRTSKFNSTETDDVFCRDSFYNKQSINFRMVNFNELWKCEKTAAKFILTARENEATRFREGYKCRALERLRKLLSPVFNILSVSRAQLMTSWFDAVFVKEHWSRILIRVSELGRREKSVINKIKKHLIIALNMSYSQIELYICQLS